MRVLLAHFVANSMETKPIAEVVRAMPHRSAVRSAVFEELTALELTELTHEEVDLLRPETYRSWAALPGERLYSKTHGAFSRTPAGEYLLPLDVTLASVYLVRNPLDVAVSWKFFFDKGTFDESIEDLGNEAFTLWNPKYGLRERVGDWSRHVESWRNAPFPVLVVRYEDLLADTAGTLADVVRFLGMDGGDADRIGRAIRFASFELMKTQEQEEPWETPSATSPHVRAGRTGDWRKHLSPRQAKEVLRAHGSTMSSCGYRPQDILQEIAGPVRPSPQMSALDATIS